MTSLRLACAVAGLLAAAACSSTTNGSGTAAGPSSSAPATSSTAPPSSSAPPSSESSSPPPLTPPPGSASSAILPSLVLQRSDVPSDWTASPHDNSGDTDDEQTAAVDACLGSNLQPHQGRIRQVSSDDYAKGQSLASSDASSWQTDQDVQNQIALLTNPKAEECFAKSFEDELGTLPDLKADVTIDNGNGGFPSVVIARLHAVVSYSNDGQQVQYFFNVAFIAKGTVTAEISFVGVGEQVTPSVSSGMVEAVADRVAAT